MHHVLLDALRASADVPHLLVIVLGENLHEIIREEDGVVISHHEPTYIQNRPSEKKKYKLLAAK